MLNHVRDIREAIRESYHWVDADVPIFIFIVNNAGGHGTNEAKKEYERILLDEFNVIVDWQVANSPKSNMLDLGAWMAVQSEVEFEHRDKVMQPDVLAQSIGIVFYHLDKKALHNIHERWLVVLDLMIKGKGDNELVETHRKNLIL